jgi:hypothetical protein
VRGWLAMRSLLGQDGVLIALAGLCGERGGCGKGVPRGLKCLREIVAFLRRHFSPLVPAEERGAARLAAWLSHSCAKSAHEWGTGRSYADTSGYWSLRRNVGRRGWLLGSPTHAQKARMNGAHGVLTQTLRPHIPVWRSLARLKLCPFKTGLQQMWKCSGGSGLWEFGELGGDSWLGGGGATGRVDDV